MKRLALIVLILGLAGGAAIYVFADAAEPTAYAVDPTTSKAYQRQLERYGGKAALLFDDINRWVAALIMYAVAERNR